MNTPLGRMQRARKPLGVLALALSVSTFGAGTAMAQEAGAAAESCTTPVIQEAVEQAKVHEVQIQEQVEHVAQTQLKLAEAQELQEREVVQQREVIEYKMAQEYEKIAEPVTVEHAVASQQYELKKVAEEREAVALEAVEPVTTEHAVASQQYELKKVAEARVLEEREAVAVEAVAVEKVAVEREYEAVKVDEAVAVEAVAVEKVAAEREAVAVEYELQKKVVDEAVAVEAVAVEKVAAEREVVAVEAKAVAVEAQRQELRAKQEVQHQVVAEKSCVAQKALVEQTQELQREVQRVEEPVAAMAPVQPSTSPVYDIVTITQAPPALEGSFAQDTGPVAPAPVAAAPAAPAEVPEALAFTGVESELLVAVAGGFLALGGMALVGSRRRLDDLEG